MRTAILSCAACVSIAAASPVQAADPALYQAAKKEGEVVWYTALIVAQAVRPLIEAFNKKYPGIEVHYGRADSGPTAIKIMTEARAGKVQSDVFDGIDAMPPLVEAGLVEPYVPAAADKYPPELKDPDGRWNALVLYSRRPSTPAWYPHKTGQAPHKTCSTANGRARWRGAREPPREPRSMWGAYCRAWARRTAWPS
jgi:hypothetical protein